MSVLRNTRGKQGQCPKLPVLLMTGYSEAATNLGTLFPVLR
jgi:hypothetical protein